MFLQCAVWWFFKDLSGAVLCAADTLVGQTCGFGQAEPGGAGEGNIDGVFESAEVADGDKEGFDGSFSSEDGADDIRTVGQKGIRAFFCRGIVEGSDEPAFGATDSRLFQEEAQMGSQAEAPWVSDALAVNEKGIGGGFEFFDGGDTCGGFAE